MSLDSQWNRRAAMPKPTTVTPRPKMILTGTNAPRLPQLSNDRVTDCERHLGAICGAEDSVVAIRGRSSEAEHQLPKLRTRVRFSSPALTERPVQTGYSVRRTVGRSAKIGPQTTNRPHLVESGPPQMAPLGHDGTMMNGSSDPGGEPPDQPQAHRSISIAGYGDSPSGQVVDYSE